MYLAAPERGSIHSFGMAVDATLLDRTCGAELDMGTGFDEMDEASHPEFEERYLKSGKLDSQQLTHRLALREAMTQAGFQSISTEWWHFDFGNRVAVRASFPRVL
jgi:zinc D-Ala-D-Ala dipeptidase